ncbi:MAG: hypothetical protein QXV32_01590 [Conexivisphaerales archaeon]
MENTSPLAPGIQVIITKPGSSLYKVLQKLTSEGRCLVVDVDGSATALLADTPSQAVIALSSLDLAGTMGQVVSVGKGFRVIVFNSLNTLAEMNRYKGSTKTWMRYFFRDLLLTSSFCTSLAETACFIHVLQEHSIQRLLNSWQSRVYQRIGTLWVYRDDRDEFIRISYTTRENRS